MNTKIPLNRMSWIYLGVALLLLHSLALTGYAQGQEPTPRPRPGGSGGQNNGASGGGGDSSAPLRPKTGIYGFVYNYSTPGYEGGVQVVATGSGWQAETVTDSNGYYHLRNLGFGQATLNLRLPPQAHPAAPNWPTRLIEEEGHQVDLGFYWRTPDSIPVLLSGALAGDELVIDIKNNSDQPATGGLVEIITPANLRIAPQVKTSQGQVSSFAAHRTQVEPGQIIPGQSAAITAELKPTDAAAQANAVIQVLFTYNEQITPQAIEVALNEPLIQADAARDAPEASLPDAAQTDPSSEATTPVQTAPAEAAPSDEAMMQPEETAPEQAPPAESDSPAMPAEAPAKAENNALLPETGHESSAINSVIVALTAALILALGLGGWQSLRRRNL